MTPATRSMTKMPPIQRARRPQSRPDSTSAGSVISSRPSGGVSAVEDEADAKRYAIGDDLAALHVDLLLRHPRALDVAECLAALLDPGAHGLLEAVGRAGGHLDHLRYRHRMPPLDAGRSREPSAVSSSSALLARSTRAPCGSSSPALPSGRRRARSGTPAPLRRPAPSLRARTSSRARGSWTCPGRTTARPRVGARIPLART